MSPSPASSATSQWKARLENVDLAVKILSAVIAVLLTVATTFGIKWSKADSEKANAQGAVQTLQIVVNAQQNTISEVTSSVVEQSDQIGNLGAALESAQAANSSLNQVNVELSSRNQVLSGQLASAMAASDPGSEQSTSNQASGVPLSDNISGSGKLDAASSLFGTSSVDLDNDTNERSPSADLQYLDNRYLAVLGKASFYLLDQGKPVSADQSVCASHLGEYATAQLALGDFGAGTGICVLTDQRRVVAINLIDVSLYELRFTFTTFNPPVG